MFSISFTNKSVILYCFVLLIFIANIPLIINFDIESIILFNKKFLYQSINLLIL